MSWDDKQFIARRISRDVNFHPNGPDISLHRYDRCQPSHYSNLKVTNVYQDFAKKYIFIVIANCSCGHSLAKSPRNAKP